jgi:hypothetical protein
VLSGSAGGGSWSGRPGSNRRHSAWEADVLPLNYSREGQGHANRLTPQPLRHSTNLNQAVVLAGYFTSRLFSSFSLSRFAYKSMVKPETTSEMLEQRQRQRGYQARKVIAYRHDIPAFGRSPSCEAAARCDCSQPSWGRPIFRAPEESITECNGLNRADEATSGLKELSWEL